VHLAIGGHKGGQGSHSLEPGEHMGVLFAGLVFELETVESEEDSSQVEVS
jgi:hypothetical protein